MIWPLPDFPQDWWKKLKLKWQWILISLKHFAGTKTGFCCSLFFCWVSQYNSLSSLSPRYISVKPLFEGAPKGIQLSVGWHSTIPGSTPDLLPGAWGIEYTPQDGETCIGLVTRFDGSAESIRHWQSHFGGCLLFIFRISRTHWKIRRSRQSYKITCLGSPSKQKKGSSCAVLAHQSSDWRSYDFQFITPGTIRYLTLEAWYGPEPLLSTMEHCAGSLFADWKCARRREGDDIRYREIRYTIWIVMYQLRESQPFVFISYHDPFLWKNAIFNSYGYKIDAGGKILNLGVVGFNNWRHCVCNKSPVRL